MSLHNMNRAVDADEEAVLAPQKGGRVKSRMSRVTMLKTALVGLAVPALGSVLGLKSVDAARNDDAASPSQADAFQATGPAPASGTAFDATAASNGAPAFTNGVEATGSSYAVKGYSPRTGVYGSGLSSGVSGANTSNSGPGIVGVSYADASATTPGAGSGVQGNSGTGFGVTGFSETGTGVYGQSVNVGVSGEGKVGVQGLTTKTGTAVKGSADSEGVAIEAAANAGFAILATNLSNDKPTVSVLNTGTVGGVHATSTGGYGVLGTTEADAGKFAQGSGLTGNHATGNGSGVVGYGFQNQDTAHGTKVPVATGVFGAGDEIGVKGLSSSIGIVGNSIGSATGVLGVSYKNGSQLAHGSGIGVQGNSGSGFGVAGFSETSAGVYGQADSGIGVSGRAPTGIQGEGLGNKGVGVVGNTATGTGVRGSALGGTALLGSNESTHHAAVFASNGSSGPAIEATSERGYGAELHGGKAPLRLVPAAAQGHPHGGIHQQGELIMDSRGSLFVCVNGGTPGTWRKVLLQ